MALHAPKGPALTHDTINDVTASTMEAVRLAAKTTVEGLATGIIEVGEATPIVAPIFVALKCVKEMFDDVRRNKEQLEELHERCVVITAYVITRCNTEGSKFDVTPLEDCVKTLRGLAARYSVRGTFARIVRYGRDKDLVEGLRGRIEDLVPIMGLAGIVRVSEQVEGVRQILKREFAEQKALLNCVIQGQNSVAKDTRATREDVATLLARISLSPAKLAAVPVGAPGLKGWHVARNTVVDEVYDHFLPDDGPWMVGLVGDSGSGKSTAAAMIVGDGMSVIRARGGETHEQALGRMSRVRALFSDGVVWLRVGRDAADRLPALMQELAKKVYEDMLDHKGYGSGESPTDPQNGAAYVRQTVASGAKGEGLRCLVVADDVWEKEVVEELQKTDMRVLLTTRDPALVDGAGGQAIPVSRLTKEEAEVVVIGAAELPKLSRDHHLPDAAYTVVDRCDHVPMHVESVARWAMLRGRSDGPSWQRAVDIIDHHLGEVQAENNTSGNRKQESDARADTCTAILRAGFECLGTEDSQGRWLYLALAVMPDGHAFEVYEAAVLLFGHEHTEHDLEQAGHVVVALERWAIITVAGPGLYRMHDARSCFARRTVIGRSDVLGMAVKRWRDHLSTLEVVRSVDVYAVMGLWHGIGRVGGDGWRVSRPYDAALSKLEISDPLYFPSAEVVADLYNEEGDYEGAETVMKTVWERLEGNPKANPRACLTALFHCVGGAQMRGLETEAQRLRLRMESIFENFKEQWRSDRRVKSAEEALFVHYLGLCCSSLERVEEAEGWFRRALVAQQEASLGPDHSQVASTLYGLAQCARALGRLGEAESFSRRALTIREVRLGMNAVPVAAGLGEVASCLRELGRSVEAEPLVHRALSILEAKLGAEDLQVAVTRHKLAMCLHELGRAGEAEPLFRRALDIKEAKLGVEDLQVAVTLHELARCVQQLGRAGEAGLLFRRALAIKEAKLGAEDLQVAYTLDLLARCVQHSWGVPGERRVFSVERWLSRRRSWGWRICRWP